MERGGVHAVWFIRDTVELRLYPILGSVSYVKGSKISQKRLFVSYKVSLINHTACSAGESFQSYSSYLDLI